MPTEVDPPPEGLIYSLVSGDFNGDGAQDVLSARNLSSGAEVDAMWGDCDSLEFTHQVLDDAGTGFLIGYWEELFAAADVDGDGDLDVLGFDYRFGDGITWLNADGVGSSWLREPAASGSATPWDYRWVGDNNDEVEVLSSSLFDVDQDGLVDVYGCVSSYSDFTETAECRLYNGDGSGGFYESLSVYSFVSREVVGMALADFDGDGTVDLLGGLDDDGDSGQVWLWAGNSGIPGFFSGGGSPVFDLVAGNSGSDQAGFGSLAAHDFDDDGDMDVLASIQPSYGSCDRDLYIALNDGAGNFTADFVGITDCQWGGEDTVWLQDFYGVPNLP
jgi:hypothetical protein